MQLESSVTLFDDTKVETRFAELQVTADGITSEVSKKVGNDEIISRINQSAEAVTINANKVNIEGAAIFSSGRLSQSSLDGAYDASGSATGAVNNLKSDLSSSSGTTVINGGHIATGTLSAGAVNANSGMFNTANIPNLSASKITSDTLDAARIGAGSLAIGKLDSSAQATINSAGTKATNYITDIGNDGIRVHDAHTSNNSVVINSSGMEVFKGGTSDAYSVAKYGDTARIGKNANNASHVSILNDGVHIWNGVETTASNEVASFGSSEISLGKNSRNSKIKLCGNAGTIASYGGGINIDSSTVYLDASNDDDNENSYVHIGRGDILIASESVNLEGASISVDCDETIGESTISMDADWIALDRGSIYMMDGNAPARASQTANAIWSKNPYDNYRLCQPSSSSRRYKEDIKPVEDDRLDPHRLYDISVVQFKFKKGYFEPDDPYEQDRKDVIGFIAEDVYEHYPQAVIMMDDGVENWNERYIIPPMLKLIQEQKKKIDELGERIEALERTNK